MASQLARFGVASLLGAVAIIAGCQTFLAPSETALERLMQPASTPPDSVTLEIFIARVPAEQKAQAEKLWSEIDEQTFDAELRRQLVANGLRAGVVGSPPPEELSELLSLESEAPTETHGRVITAASAAPRVTRRVVQVHRGDQKPIQVSEPRDQAEVLLSENGRIGGKTFQNVHGVYSLQAEAIAGQRVHLRLTPELNHGEMRMRYTGGEQGIMLKNLAQEREIFDRLAINADLAAGDLLVLGSLPDAKASLGGVMHMASSAGKDERKLVVVRLLEVPPTEILAKK